MSREKVYVVDENDNVIEEKWRDETTPEDRIRIVAIWVQNDKGEVLIAQRSPNRKLHPNLWGPSAAGGVTVGEDYLAAATKELHEELGLNILEEQVTMTQVDKFKIGTTEPDDGLRMLAVFTCIINWPIEQFTVPEDEVASVKWVAKAELINDVKNHPTNYIPSAITWNRYL